MHKYRPLGSRQTTPFLKKLLEKSAKNQVEGIYFNFSKTHAKLLLSQDSVLSLGKKAVLPILTGVQRVSGRGCFRTSCPTRQVPWSYPAALCSHSKPGNLLPFPAISTVLVQQFVWLNREPEQQTDGGPGQLLCAG